MTYVAFALRGLAGAVLAILVVSTQAAVAAKRLAPPPNLNGLWARYLSKPAGPASTIAFPYDGCFRRAAAAHDLPLTLLVAVARGESDFDPRARSRANAFGLMQILWPQSAHHLGIYRLSDLYDPCTNVEAGARYLRELLERYEGNLHLALAAYNYGPSRIPDDPARMPTGARWYSGYIYRHLQHVLDSAKASVTIEQRRYHRDRKKRLITFDTPYRAAAFVERLNRVLPAVRLDLFRTAARTFSVVVLYRGEGELSRSRVALSRMGFTVK